MVKDLRHRLNTSLKSRRWKQRDASDTAALVAGLYRGGEGEWKIWQSVKSAGAGLYRVARDETAVSAFATPFMERAIDVANALNELERHRSDATGTS